MYFSTQLLNFSIIIWTLKCLKNNIESSCKSYYFFLLLLLLFSSFNSFQVQKQSLIKNRLYHSYLEQYNYSLCQFFYHFYHTITHLFYLCAVFAPTSPNSYIMPSCQIFCKNFQTCGFFHFFLKLAATAL